MNELVSIIQKEITMADDLDKSVELAIRDLAKSSTELEKSNGQDAPGAALGESAKQILDQTQRDVLTVFQSALDRLNDTRRACDAAELRIKEKRADVDRALFQYIQSVEVLATSNAKMQQAISDLAIVNDQV